MSSTMSAPAWQRSAEERQLQDGLVTVARVCGFMVYHTWDSRRSAPGFPDLICVKGHRMLALEIKQQRGRVSEAQREWIAELGQVPGCTAVIVRPEPRDETEISYEDVIRMMQEAA